MQLHNTIKNNRTQMTLMKMIITDNYKHKVKS